MLIQSQGFLTFDKGRAFVVSVLWVARAERWRRVNHFWRVLVGPMNHSWRSIFDSNENTILLRLLTV